MSNTDEELKDKALMEKMDGLKVETSPEKVGLNAPASPSATSDDSGSPDKEEAKRGNRRRFRRDPRTDPERLREWEESQKKKEVIETGLKGTVKWYSVRGHYGFIARDDGKGDIFVHQSAISKSPTEKFYLRSLADNQHVEFNIVQGEKGLEASHVTGPEGTEVKEVKLFRRGYFSRPYKRYPKKNEGGDSKDVSKSGGGTETGSDRGKTDKPRRRQFFRRRPRPNGEKGDSNDKPRNNRRRRQKSGSAVSNTEARNASAASGQGTGEEPTLIDTKA